MPKTPISYITININDFYATKIETHIHASLQICFQLFLILGSWLFALQNLDVEIYRDCRYWHLYQKQHC